MANAVRALLRLIRLDAVRLPDISFNNSESKLSSKVLLYCQHANRSLLIATGLLDQQVSPFRSKEAQC